jgi:SAM-dependent methyltransferase
MTPGHTSAAERKRRLYQEHHERRRDGGDLVFVPERIPLLVAAVGGPGRRVLDLGCRTGQVSRAFLPGNTVVGLDLDREALARAAAAGIEPVEGDVEEPLPFPDDAFDAVVAGELFEHLRAPGDLVEEIRRVLRPGGTIVGSVPNAFRVKCRWRVLRGRQPEDDPTHLHLFAPRDLRSLLAGFDGLRIDFVGGRYARYHPRLLARDMVFSASRPA